MRARWWTSCSRGDSLQAQCHFVLTTSHFSCAPLPRRPSQDRSWGGECSPQGQPWLETWKNNSTPPTPHHRPSGCQFWGHSGCFSKGPLHAAAVSSTHLNRGFLLFHSSDTLSPASGDPLLNTPPAPSPVSASSFRPTQTKAAAFKGTNQKTSFQVPSPTPSIFPADLLHFSQTNCFTISCFVHFLPLPILCV